jgi:hypothetical protein
MHGAEQYGQERLMPQEAEVKDDGSICYYDHRESSARRVSKSCANISSVKVGMCRA